LLAAGREDFTGAAEARLATERCDADFFAGPREGRWEERDAEAVFDLEECMAEAYPTGGRQADGDCPTAALKFAYPRGSHFRRRRGKGSPEALLL
jgi:hypothetical protein